MRRLLFVFFIALELSFPKINSNFFKMGTPIITFDKKNFVWILRNLRIERKIAFRNGGLFTVSLKDKFSSIEYVSRPSCEAILKLYPPLLPLNLTKGWKMTQNRPPEGWQNINFDDSDWQNFTPFFLVWEDNQIWWLRKKLSLRPGEKYLLEFNSAIDDYALIYIDGKLVREVKTEETPWLKTISIPINSVQVLAIELRGHGKPNGINGLITLTPLKDIRIIDLSKDWKFKSYKIQKLTEGKDLCISLEGDKGNKGWKIDIHYTVYPGNQPWLSKWLEVKCPDTYKSFILREVILENIAMTERNYNEQAFPGTSRAVWTDKGGLVGGVCSILGKSRFEDGTFQLILNYDGAIGGKFQTPKCVIGTFEGNNLNGAFIYQLYMAHHYVRATPHSVPPLYNTWFGYWTNINERLLEKIIPIARELGCEYFVLDSGWFEIRNGDGVYGDWVFDKTRFPRGLEYIGELCKKNGLRLGLWFAPILATPGTELALKHSYWVVKRGGEIVKQWGPHYAMCLGSDYKEYMAKKLKEYVDKRVVFFKFDAGLLEAGCSQPKHLHPPGYSLSAQWDGWRHICEEMRRINPKVIVDRGWERGPEVCNVNDEGWFGDWEIGYDLERQKDVRWWYKNADIYRRTLWELTLVRPPFTITWETPCHLPIGKEDLDALEYHFTSIGAYICNVEIHGKLEEMTEKEKDVIRKWIKWNKENREWLAFAQPILDRPWDPRNPDDTPHIDGVMHLRPLYKGKYGYICLWNPSSEEDEAIIEFVPKNYLIDMDFGRLKIKSIKNGREIDWQRINEKLRMKVSLPPLSWEIFELGVK